ncbi:hypothetical protein GQ53DRAFT_348397 [Thozetella sp. PMI_491]|nr:hypothetical protein GQ53DRAFT_348397 [Thozetella sp. PMI_491]
MQLLSRRSDPNMSVEEQWLSVWDIIFPSAERPSRVRLTEQTEFAVTVLRCYWAQNGRHIVADFLEQEQLRGYNEVQDEERELEALYVTVLEQMIDEVVARSQNDDTSAATSAIGRAGGILEGVRAFFVRALLNPASS